MRIIMGIIYLLYILLISNVTAELTISKVIVRVPRENDIGLVFDLTVSNVIKAKKEQFEFVVRGDGTCSLNLTNNKVMCNAGRIVGGNFGYIKPGEAETVSLIWPTTSLYNRIGRCPILITSTTSDHQKVHMRQLLHFDTRFTTLDPEARNLRKLKGYRDCQNWDKDYFRNCTPVNCEERYFGRRSFYNTSTEQCEEVPRCDKPEQLYDPFANECVDPRHFCTSDDVQAIRKGHFHEAVLDSDKDASLTKLKSSKENAWSDSHEKTKNDHRGAMVETDGEKQSKVRSINSNELTSLNDQNESDSVPYWMKGIADGLLIVLATLAIYVLICFMIYLIVSWMGRESFNDYHSIEPSPVCARSSNSVTLCTTSSLLSHER